MLALPLMLRDLIFLGHIERKSSLASTVTRCIASTDVPGFSTKCIRKSVSWKCGRNSCPSRAAAAPVTRNASTSANSAMYGRATNAGRTAR